MRKPVITHRRARQAYTVLERLEAGIVLKGSEVKSLRAGRGSLEGAFCRFKGEEVWLVGMHIPPHQQASTHERLDPLRDRKLLLHKGEIRRLHGQVSRQGLSLVPLSVYFSGHVAKVELGLVRGKRKAERREEIAEREAAREVERALASRRKRGLPP